MTKKHGGDHGGNMRGARIPDESEKVFNPFGRMGESEILEGSEAEPPLKGSKSAPAQENHGATVAGAPPWPAPFYDERSLHALALERARREGLTSGAALLINSSSLPSTPAGRIAFVGALLAPGHASTCECEECEEEGDGVPELLEPIIMPEQAHELLDIPDFTVRA